MPSEILKFKPVALPCGEAGSTPLFTTNLFRGGCPHSCAYCYASGFKDYAAGDPEPVSTDAIKNIKKWPKRLFLCSASDPFHPKVVELAEILLEGALSAGTFVVISTKALATPKIAKLLGQHRDQVSYTVSLSNLDEKRNAFLEPHAPSAAERLHGKWHNNELVLCGIDQLAQKGVNVTLKADTLFPGIDDREQNISDLLSEAKDGGVRAVNFSYAFYRNRFKKRLSGIPFISRSLVEMNEYQPIASGKGYSLPLVEKKKRLIRLALIAKDMGYEVISTCACKNRVGSVPGDVPMRLDCHFHDRWF